LGGILGVLRHNGGFAEYFKIPGRQLFHLPDSISFEEGGVIADAVVCTVHAVLDRAEVKISELAMVVGVGGVGTSVLQVAKACGARVVAVDLHEEKLACAREFGSDPPPTHYFGHCFSISEAEVLTPKGENVALISRGAGVQVSSTHTGYGMDRFTQDMLWPTQYDLGFKWTRVGYDMSLYQWAYVERQKGKLHVDDRADEVVTEAVKNGVQVVMSLDKGNWLYAATPKTPDRTRDLMETYSNNPGKGTEYDPMLAGYLNYVRFMVRHFKDRVTVFEVWNEWGPYTYDEAKKYAVLLKKVIPIIREEAPQAKIMLASPGWLVQDKFGWFRALGEEGLLSQVDVIGFHPFYNPSPADPYLVSFHDDFPQFQKMLAGYGFKGSYMASEWDYFTAYPPSDLPGYVDRETHSEIQKAIYAARLSTTFAHFDIVNLWNETFQTQQTMRGLSLFRNTFANEVMDPTRPEPVYYAFRTLSTALALLVNGHVFPEIEGGKVGDEYEERKLVYRNLGNAKFEDVSLKSGPGILLRRCARGAAFGDLFNTGQIDVVINNMNDIPSLLRNVTPSPHNWFQVSLIGRRANRAAIGSRATLWTGQHRQIAEVQSGESFCSQNDLRLHFGLGTNKKVDRLDIGWLGGGQESYRDLGVNCLATIVEGEGVQSIKQPGPRLDTFK
jgi:hypothetical protein